MTYQGLHASHYINGEELYYLLLAVVIDSGCHRTSEDYDLCRMYRGRLIAYICRPALRRVC